MKTLKNIKRSPIRDVKNNQETGHRPYNLQCTWRARSNKGKSFLTILMQMHIAKHTNWLGINVYNGRETRPQQKIRRVKLYKGNTKTDTNIHLDDIKNCEYLTRNIHKCEVTHAFTWKSEIRHHNSDCEHRN